MDNLSISAAAGMRARLESLDLLANNLANAATAGYKADREFHGLFRSEAAAGGWSGSEPPALPLIERNWTDFSQGTLEESANPFAVALEGRGFFIAEGPQGRLLTRNGDFRLNAAGTLVTRDGYPVRTREEPAHRLVLDPTDTRPVEIRRDATVWRDGQQLASLEIADGPPESARKHPGGYFRFEATHLRDAPDAVVHQGRIERSNTGPAESAIRLISVMRQFEMLQRAVTTASEMNRRATDEVARVS